MQWIRQHLRPQRKNAFERVLEQLAYRDIPLAELDALEMFGGRGDFVTKYYADKVRSLEIWEIRSELEPTLRRGFPDATVKITDAFEEIHTTTQRFSLVVMDDPVFVVMQRMHYEHFDLFPHVFRILQPRAILALNIVFDYTKARERCDNYYHHQQARAQFYGTQQPDELTMLNTYRMLAEQQGYALDWYLLQRRTDIIQWLILKLSHDSAR